MKIKLTLSLLVFLTGNLLSGQTFLPGEGFFPGKLIYSNGIVKTGFIAAPKKARQGFIYFKSDKDGSKEKIKSDYVDSISMQTDEGKTFLFERLPWDTKPGAKIRNKMWFFVNVKGYANLYIYSDIYLITQKGNAYVVSNGTVFWYLIRKKNQKIAHYFGATSSSKGVMNLHHILKKSASLYLSEDADLVKKINNRQLTHSDIEEIINIYNEFMSTKQ